MNNDKTLDEFVSPVVEPAVLAGYPYGMILQQTVDS